MGPVSLLIAAACALPGDVGSLPATGHVLRGDVDGDGRAENVVVRYRPEASASCGFFLTAEGASRIRPARVRMPLGKFVTTREYVRYDAVPTLRVLAAIDRRPGGEALIELWRGASSHGGSVFTTVGQRLVRMNIDRSWNDEFSWWGSVTHNANVDCIGGRDSGRVVVRSGGVDASGRALLEARSLYVVRGTSFTYVRSRSRSGLRPGERWWTDIADVGGGPPFRRCAVATAPRF